MPLRHPQERKAGGGRSHDWWHTMGWEAAIWMFGCSGSKELKFKFRRSDCSTPTLLYYQYIP
eukprot:scaffold108040_cov32-Tisochrysis_lutea.AAC.1